jgi:hypothetical protein
MCGSADTAIREQTLSVEGVVLLKLGGSCVLAGFRVCRTQFSR